jgi:hypothetical protein
MQADACCCARALPLLLRRLCVPRRLTDSEGRVQRESFMESMNRVDKGMAVVSRLRGAGDPCAT